MVPAAQVPAAPKDVDAGTFTAEIVAEGGAIDLRVQQGRHVTVNGERLLTETEVDEKIRGAVAAALDGMANALKE